MSFRNSSLSHSAPRPFGVVAGVLGGGTTAWFGRGFDSAAHLGHIAESANRYIYRTAIRPTSVSGMTIDDSPSIESGTPYVFPNIDGAINGAKARPSLNYASAVIFLER